MAKPKAKARDLPCHAARTDASTSACIGCRHRHSRRPRSAPYRGGQGTCVTSEMFCPSMITAPVCGS